MTHVRGQVRRNGWERLSRGLYATTPRTLTDELLAWQSLLPDHAAFTHLSAAAVYGWWLPAPIDHPHFVALRTEDPRPRRSKLFACRHPKPVATTTLGALRVTTPAETLLAAARDLGVLDLVVLGDAMLRMGHVTPAELWQTALKRRRGGPLLRTVLPLLDARSESPWESIMRVLHQQAGIPVRPQYEILDDTGTFVARADLLIIGTRRIHEYDGEVHRDRDQHVRDLTRERALQASGWQRFGFSKHHLLTDAASIIRSTDTVLDRPWRPHRVTAWNDLVEHSLLGRTGRGRAYGRWRRAAET